MSIIRRCTYSQFKVQYCYFHNFKLLIIESSSDQMKKNHDRISYMNVILDEKINSGINYICRRPLEVPTL